jgi:hypothetical protein
MAWLRLLAFAVASTALPVGAVTYCCTDDNGRRVCSDSVPVQCRTRAYQEFSSQGIPVKTYEAPLTTEQRARRDAETARRKAEDEKAADQQRRDRSLMASYASTADIDAKRDRMLVVARASLKLAQEGHQAAQARGKSLHDATLVSQGKPMPEALKANIRDNEAALAAQEAAVAAREKDIEDIEARFEDEKKRYIALGGRQADKNRPPEAKPKN